jgi:glycosyltransferase involved in cell wall biosynthesis
MSISVIIPAYNAGVTIARAIESVLNQTLPPDEVIVVDDGSTDDTAEVIKKFGNQVHYIFQENSSCGAARNTGIRAANCEWIAFQDADDEWLAHKLETQVKLLEANPELQWSGSNCYLATGAQCSYKSNPARAKAMMSGPGYYDNFFRAFSKNSFRLHPNTVIIKRHVFDEIGLFNEELLRSEDTDMWCRIAFVHPKFGFVPEPLTIAHLDAQNPDLVKLRIEAKSGVYFRKMVQSHLPLAEKYNYLPEYKAFASLVLRRCLAGTIFHGLKADARETVNNFKNLFPWYWRIGTYLLTIFPKITVKVLRTLAYLVHITSLKKSATRRWSYSEEKTQ